MRTRALVAIFLANAIGGMSYLAQKLALEGLPPTTITLGRNVVAIVALWIWARSRGGVDLSTTPRERWLLFLLGNLSFAGAMLLGQMGVERSTAANGSILILLEPGVILLLSWWLLSERVTGRQVVGVFVGLVGALVIVLKDAPVEGLLAEEHLTGNVLLVVHGVLWGTYTPIARILSRTKRALDITLLSMLWAMVLLVPGTLLEVSEWEAGPALVPALLWTLALGIVVTFAATFLWNFAVTQLPGRTIAPFIFWQPVAGAAVAWAVLGEELSTAAWVGTAIIAGGVLLVIRGGRDDDSEASAGDPAPPSSGDRASA